MDKPRLVLADGLRLLEFVEHESVDLVFADPPYFLSNGGATCKSGKRASVDKGPWDNILAERMTMQAFNERWIAAARLALKPSGSIAAMGTMHNIYSIGRAMDTMGLRTLNEIIWQKPAPPPNLGCRCLTHDHENILWAARGAVGDRHYFDYPAMKELNGGKQMLSIWKIKTAGKAEKTHGGHPTQKPVELLKRIILMACPPGGLVLDPFMGSGTTGVAALELGRRFVGIEREPKYLELAERRLKGIKACA